MKLASLLICVAAVLAATTSLAQSGDDDLSRRVAELEHELQALKYAPPDPFLTIGAVEAPDAKPADDKVAAFEKKWEKALKAATDKSFPTFTVIGVFQADAVWVDQDDASLATFGPIQDGADIRRARLGAKGAVAENMNYFMQFDFGFFGRPTFTDVWLEITHLPLLGTFRIGQWKQPFSLEVVSSFRYTTFMERSLLFQAFTPFRHLGAGFYDYSEDLSRTWAFSVFRTGQDQYGNSISTDGGWGGAGRLTWLPWYDEPAEGRYYWHLGSAYYYNSPPRDLVRFRTIPEMFVGEHAPNGVGTSGQAIPGVLNGVPFFVDTGPLLASDVHTFGLESLYVRGPFSLQAEWMAAIVNQLFAPVGYLHGGYAQAGFFLTGEHRPYDRKLGQIDRVKPFEDFFRVGTPHGICSGWGAWEVAARISYIDLNDDGIRGGDLVDTTLGLNWYLNPYCKFVANWVHAFLDHPVTGNSDTDLYGIRAQLDF